MTVRLPFLLILAIACSPESFIPDEALEDNTVEGMGQKKILSLENTFDIPGLGMHQSMAFHEGMAVFVTPVGDVLTGDIYNLETKAKEASLYLPHDGYPVPHANVSCFGRSFCSEDSLFPALYVSAWNGGRQVFVYDIFKTKGEFGTRLIQVIDPGHLDSGFAGLGQMDWVVDTDHDRLFSIAYGLDNSPYIYDGNCTNICQFKLPAPGSGNVVYLEDTDIVDHFVLPVMNVFQDKCYSDGHIYVVAGIPDRDNLYPPRLYDIDIQGQSLEEKKLSIIGEPEGFCSYQGIRWLNMNSSTKIYNIADLI